MLQTQFFKDTVSAVTGGTSFKIDFKNRSFKLGNKTIITSEGLPSGFEPPMISQEEALSTIESLYMRYYHSIPSESDTHSASRYFKALPETELSDEDMLYGEPRRTARLRLELYVLVCIVTGILKWDCGAFAKSHWFWQSTDSPTLILFREWFTR